jgi:hypothetical protein
MSRPAANGDFGIGDESAHPHLWHRCVSAFCPSLGATGNRLHDYGFMHYPASTTSGSLFGVVDGQWAVTLNGTSNYYSITNLTATNFNTDNFTVCGWAKPSSLSASGVNTVVSRSAGTGTPVVYYGWLIGFENQYPYGYAGTSSVNYPITSSTIATAGSWYHLAYVRRATEAELFVNGSSAGTVAIPAGTGLSTSSIALAIGRRETAASYSYFGGSVDDIRLYRRALDQTEVAQLASRRGIAYEPRRLAVAFDSSGSPKRFHARKTFSRVVH